MLKNFNWETLKPGECIFVPTLDVYKTREMGLRAAICHGTKTYAKIGIKDGLLGVLFFRRGKLPS